MDEVDGVDGKCGCVGKSVEKGYFGWDEIYCVRRRSGSVG